MRIAIAILGALLCASCGGGSAGPAATDPPAAAASVPSASSAATAPAPAAPTAPAAPAAPSTSAPPSSAPSTTSGSPLYEVIEIPRLAATGSVTASAVNDQGVVVGAQETTGADRAWMYQQSSGALDELTLDPSELGAHPNGISNGGVITGYEVPSGGTPLPGFWTTTGGAMVLNGSYPDFTEAVAANDSGTLIGNLEQSGSVSSQPLVWTAPGYAQSPLPGLACDACTRIAVTASAINGNGLIVGSSSYGIYDGSGNYVTSGLHAVSWQNGTIADLGGLQGAQYSAASSVNDSGDVVGGSRTDQTAGAPTHAFLDHGGVMTDLGTLPGDTDSTADSINDSGEIVGESSSGSASHAFLYQNGRMVDLNSLLDPASALAGRVSLQEAVSISANGWIAVNGTDSRDPGWTRAFLLIPAH